MLATEKSKVSSNICSTRSFSSRGGVQPKNDSRKAERLAWVIGTPLGAPVLPEVKMM